MKGKLYRIADFILLTAVILLWSQIIKYKWANSFVTPPLSVNAQVATYRGDYEFCVLAKDGTSLVDQMEAGTPVPSEPIPIGPTEIPPTANVLSIPTQNAGGITIPTPFPTPSIPPENDIQALEIEVVKPENFAKTNYHIVFLGVGYSETENEKELAKLISGVRSNFNDVAIDFAFVEKPAMLNLSHVQSRVNISNDEYLAILGKVNDVYPVDGVVLAMNTSLPIGTAYRSPSGESLAALSSSNPAAVFIMTHEIGHQLGLADGYSSYYPPELIPNDEFFYLDKMPRYLSEALKKLETVPPLYQVGTCNGEPLYQFYESSNNIYGDYSPQGPNSWGESIFTPLQIRLMNDFVKRVK